MPELRKLTVAFVLAVLPIGLVGCWAELGSDEDSAPLYRGADPFADDSEAEPPSSVDDDDDDNSGDDDAAGGTGGMSGEAGIIVLQPAPDSTDHHYRRPIAITFEDDGSGTIVRVFGPSDESGGGELPLRPPQWSENTTHLEIQPDSFLLPETQYRVAIEQNDSLMEYSFTTSSVGRPLDEGVAIQGQTYSVLLGNAVAVSPAGLGPLLATAPLELSWLWQFHHNLGSSGLEVDTGLASVQEDGFVMQDECTPTSQLLSAGDGLSLDGAYFSGASAGSDRLTLWLGHELLEFEDAVVDGDFASDGSSIEEVSVRGWLSGDSLAVVVPEESPAASGVSQACLWVEEHLEASCETCPSGIDGCLWVHVGSMSGGLQEATLASVEPATVTPCDGDDAFTEAMSCSVGGIRRLPSAALLLLPWAMLLRRRP